MPEFPSPKWNGETRKTYSLSSREIECLRERPVELGDFET